MIIQTPTRKTVDPAATCAFYRAAFTTEISRIRFNQQLLRRRRRQSTFLGL